MANYTSNTYILVRKVLTFTDKISNDFLNPNGNLLLIFHMDGYKFEALGVVRDGSEILSLKILTKRAIAL